MKTPVIHYTDDRSLYHVGIDHSIVDDFHSKIFLYLDQLQDSSINDTIDLEIEVIESRYCDSLEEASLVNRGEMKTFFSWGFDIETVDIEYLSSPTSVPQKIIEKSKSGIHFKVPLTMTHFMDLHSLQSDCYDALSRQFRDIALSLAVDIHLEFKYCNYTDHMKIDSYLDKNGNEIPHHRILTGIKQDEYSKLRKALHYENL